MSVHGTHSRIAAADYPAARHRADRTPDLVPQVRPSRRAHLDHRRRRLVMLRTLLLALAAGVVLAVAFGSWRPFGEAGGGRTDVGTLPETAGEAGLAVTIGRNGDLRVATELVRSSGKSTPTLRVPGHPGTGFRPQVTVEALVVDAATVPLEETLRRGAALEVPEAAGATRLNLDYAATGTYAASEPSAPGRGLVLLNPLRIDGWASNGRLEVTDPRIRNVACWAGDAPPRVCGTRDGDTWVVGGVADGEDVVAQVDLAVSGRR